MNKLSQAAAILGKKGGESGTGAAKSRGTEKARAAAMARWRNPELIKKRFWEKVQIGKPDECWEWQFACFNTGYGCACFPKPQLAHRLAWTISRGPIPKGMWVLHHCDNKKCCNPSHLFLGNGKDNTADMFQKGRNRNPKGSDLPTSKLNESIVKTIRKDYASGQMNQRDIAKKYKVSQSTVSEAITGKLWRHVKDGFVPSNSIQKWKSADNAYQSKLCSADVIQMRKDYSHGLATITSLAEKYGVSKVTARYAIRGITWKSVAIIS